MGKDLVLVSDSVSDKCDEPNISFPIRFLSFMIINQYTHFTEMELK
jgi:hypothetical protein